MSAFRPTENRSYNWADHYPADTSCRVGGVVDSTEAGEASSLLRSVLMFVSYALLFYFVIFIPRIVSGIATANIADLLIAIAILAGGMGFRYLANIKGLWKLSFTTRKNNPLLITQELPIYTESSVPNRRIDVVLSFVKGEANIENTFNREEEAYKKAYSKLRAEAVLLSADAVVDFRKTVTNNTIVLTGRAVKLSV